MSRIRLGAVGYLNARPLVYGLDSQRTLFDIRFDVPAICAALLHQRTIDLGLIPSIEYLRDPDYRIVPDIAIASDGPVRSVALFSTRPTPDIRSIAVDSGSRTSVALLRILCAHWFKIEPKMTVFEPALPEMIRHADAALVIGDAALFADHAALGLKKIDLGEAWMALTGLPFVYAFWAGPAEVLRPEHVAALRAARDEAAARTDEIARGYFPAAHEKAEIGATYLRDNIKYMLGDRECAGLRKFYQLACDLRLVEKDRQLRFFDPGH